jgi:hypothetical protein
VGVGIGVGVGAGAVTWIETVAESLSRMMPSRLRTRAS